MGEQKSKFYHWNSKKTDLPSPEEERERFYSGIRGKIPALRLRHLAAFHLMVCLLVLGAFFIGSLVMEKPTFSQIERRDLAAKPSFSLEKLFAGELTRQAEDYYADTFPFREWFVSLSAVIDESRGIRMDDVRIIHSSVQETQDTAVPIVSQSGPSGPEEEAAVLKLPQEEQEPQAPEPQAVLQPDGQQGQDAGQTADGQQGTAPDSGTDGLTTEISNGTFVYKGMAMSLFGGDTRMGDWYAQVLNTYHEELPDVQIYNMIIPTAIEFYVPDKYRDLTGSQKAMIDHIYAQEDPAIKKVDAYGALGQHTDEYLYFRTDHHWTGLGAYYAYTAFCEQAGFEPIRLEDCETRRLENFVGSMYAQTQDSTLLKNPDYVDYYIFPQECTSVVRYDRGAPYYPIAHSLWGEYAQSPNSYSVFLHGDFPLIKAVTGLDTGRKAVVVKESFGNAFAPFLINHFDEVYIVDQRYFQLSLIDLIQENGVTDLIFANNTFAACTPYHIQCIDNLRHQVFIPAPAASEPKEEDTDTEKTVFRMKPETTDGLEEQP